MYNYNYNVTSATAKFQFSSGSSQSNASSGTDAFAAMLEQLKNGTTSGTSSSSSTPGISGSGQSSMQSSLLDYLSQRFPSVSFQESKVGSSPKDVQDVLGNEEGDKAAVDPAVAEAVAGGNTSLAEMIEKALQAFTDTQGQTATMDGTYQQRSMILSVTTIRISVSNFDTSSGELMNSNELQSSFSDSIKDMINKFFGTGPVKETTSDDAVTEGDDETAAAEETKGSEDTKKTDDSQKTNLPNWFGSGASLSMYFSASFFSGSASNLFSNSADQTGGTQFQGNFQSFSASFSYSMLSGMQNSGFDFSSGFGSGAFTSMLDAGMSQLGLSTDSMWQQDGGYMMKFRESRNLISELMSSLYNNRQNPVAEEPVDTTDVTEEAPAEEAVAVE